MTWVDDIYLAVPQQYRKTQFTCGAATDELIEPELSS